MGLNPHRDRLCLVQLSAGDGAAHLVQLIPPRSADVASMPEPEAADGRPRLVKLMHFGRFDVAVLQHTLDITVAPVKCTKIAARLTRTFTDRHGLRDLCRELLGVEISKQQQTSDWGAPELTPEQLAYAATDVLHLHALWARLEALLMREHRLALRRRASGFCRRGRGWICWAMRTRTCSRTEPGRVRAAAGDGRAIRHGRRRPAIHDFAASARPRRGWPAPGAGTTAHLTGATVFGWLSPPRAA